MSNAAHRFLIILAITGCGDSYNAFSRWAPIRHPICHGTHHLPPNCAPSPRGRGDTQCGVGRAPPGFSKFTRIRGESKRSTVRLLSSSSSADSSADGVIPTTTDDPNEQSMTTLDRTLSRLTQGFPLYVLLAALSGVYKPSLLTWVNHGSLISVLLASVMCGTGLSLQADDFRRIPPYLVAFGVACQFLIMPVSSFLVANTWLKADPDLFLGLCLVGCSPGGTASNLVSLIANADVALSVVLTACSTLLAVVVTPALVKLLVSSTVSGSIAISGLALVQATAKVVFAPVLLGMFLKSKAPRFADAASRFTPFCSALLVALICGGVVAQNTVQLQAVRSGPMLWKVLRSVLTLHGLGFGFGYVLPMRLLPRHGKKAARTISIEVGMQNSALAVVLARSITSNPAAALPGALSATAHSCLGSLLAAIWRSQDDEVHKTTPNAVLRAGTVPQILPGKGDNDPEFSI